MLAIASTPTGVGIVGIDAGLILNMSAKEGNANPEIARWPGELSQATERKKQGFAAFAGSSAPSAKSVKRASLEEKVFGQVTP